MSFDNDDPPVVAQPVRRRPELSIDADREIHPAVPVGPDGEPIVVPMSRRKFYLTTLGILAAIVAILFVAAILAGAVWHAIMFGWSLLG